jgi:hypothetical protein
MRPNRASSKFAWGSFPRINRKGAPTALKNDWRAGAEAPVEVLVKRHRKCH